MDAYDGEADFEGRLKNKLNNEYSERVQFCDMKNGQLQSTAESMRLSILGRDAKAKDDRTGYADQSVQCNHIYRDSIIILPALRKFRT